MLDTEILELLGDLKKKGIKLSVNEGKLKIQAPKDAMTSEMKEKLKNAKEEILAFLSMDDKVRKLPVLEKDPENRYEAFSLTDVQHAYWVGRNGDYELGNVATHVYYEFEEENMDAAGIETAWNKLVKRHDMLRAIIHTDGTQQVLKEVPEYKIDIFDLQQESEEVIEHKINEIRDELSHQVLASDHWPLFDLRITRLPNNMVRLHVSVDLLIVDGLSCQILLKELADLYHNPELELEPISLTFRDYIKYYEKIKELDIYKEDFAYWKDRVPNLPGAPLLKLKTNPEDVKNPHFIRKSATLPRKDWAKLKEIAKKYNVTPSMVLLTAYVNVLSVWSKYANFCINVTLFNRPPVNEEINTIIGDFTTLNLLEVCIQSGKSFSEQAKEIQSRMWKDLDHRNVGGVQVMREMAKLQGTSKGSSMPVVFTSELLTADDSMFEVDSQNENENEWNITVSGIGKQVYGISQTPQVWLDHQVGERAGTLTFNWDVMEDLFDKDVIDAMFDGYCSLLQRLVDENAIWEENDMSLVTYKAPSQETENIITEEDIANQDLLSFISVDDKKYADHTAIIADEKSLTYKELDELSNQIGNWVKAQGVKENELVGIVMEKGWEQIVAAIGILKSGAAYLPVSADFPRERVQLLLKDSECRCVLTVNDNSIKEKITDGYQVLCVDEVSNSELSTERPVYTMNPDNLAYVIYTSGSTGKPKGVMINHKGAVNTIMDINKRYDVKDTDHTFAISALNFDLSVYDIFGTLSAKGAIVVPSKDYEKNPESWYTQVSKENVTVWNSVPALVEMLVEYVEGAGKTLPSSLRLVLMSGDNIPVSLVNRLKNLNREIQLVSLGGATEASIWSINHDITNGDVKRKSIPYGKALSNQQMYVLDDKLQVRVEGVPGKIYIGGIGLTMGYWKDDEKTNESLIINPITKEKLYYTGDWGYYEADGTIIFLGREDKQVKVGGYRIELGEIESIMAQYEGVKMAAAVIKTDENQKSKTIVAYYDTLDGKKVNENEYKEYLQNCLPSYMVPGFIYFIEEMPLTSNGKIDRNALVNQTASLVKRVFVAPKTKIEKSLVAILEEGLDVHDIGIEHNYFELGGDSIVAIKLLVTIRKTFDIDITAKMIFEHPVIKDLAAEIANICTLEEFAEEMEEEPEPVEEIQSEITIELPKISHNSKDEYEPYPLTELQQAYYVGRSDAIAFGNVACHTYEEIDVRDFKLEHFTKAWRKLIDRHDVLRTIVHADGTQQMLKDLPDYVIELTDISDKPQNEKEEKLLAIREEMSHKVIDISKWPLFELKATKMDDRITRLHIGIDAMIADAWSVGILSEEVCKLYADESYYLEPLEITYRDYVTGELALRETETFKESLDYWRNILSTLEPAPDLPLVKDFSTIEQPKFKRRRKELDPGMWAQLKKASQAHGLTPSGIMMAAFAEVLTHWCKSSKFTLNVPQFNRLPLHRQVDDLIGEFASFYLMPIDNSASNRFVDRAKKIQSDLWEHMNHSVVSGVQMLREYSNMYGNGETLSMPIVYTSTIGLMDQDNSPFEGFGDVVFSISQTPQVWLDCQIGEKGNTVIFNWDAVEDIFPKGMLDDMFAGYCKLLNDLAFDETAWIRESFDLLPNWQKKLMADVNETFVDIEPELLQISFARQAEKNPDNIAVITTEKALSYHTLYCYADQLGKWLIEKDAKPNTIVALVMEKGWEQIAGVMATLNAGAAYVPVDIALPEERICYILENSEAKVVLTQSKLKNLINWPEGITVCCVDEFEVDESIKPQVNAIQNVDDLAYLIYTSGSTGEPKGVMITHQNVYNMVWHTNKYLNVTEKDKAIAVTALHHDLSVYDVFGMLSAGGAIVIPDQETRLEANHLYDLVQNEQVTLWNSVPAILEMFIQHCEENSLTLPDSFRQVIIGGDWIPVTLPDRVRNCGTNTAVLGIGGPTETTVWNIWSPVGEVEEGQSSIPYGKPISNSQYFILDEYLEERPVWVVGELYCAGTQLAKGYWKDIDKTKERFFLHPATGERIYKTGDLGRYLPDGNIEFAGRADFQVKINGLRIELGEIESTILEIPDVRQAVTCVFDDNNAKHIVAFVVDKNASEAPEVDLNELDEVNVISDPIARLEFKQKKLGIRKDTDKEYIDLPDSEITEEQKKYYIDRRSYRYFVKEEIPLAVMARLFGCLRYIDFDNLPFPKYRYASAGGLYPLQAYIYVKPNRVEGFKGGTYYYKPDEHKFMILDENAEITNGIFPPGNKEIFDEAAFTIFLVSNMDAIRPMYGPLTDKFCYIEAGIVSQMLETIALENDLGFCQIGKIAFDEVKDLFKLGENHQFLHCLLAGGVDQTQDKYQALVNDMSGYKLSVEENSARDSLAKQIVATLEEKLPNYMVPSKVILLEKIPVTPNGKIDRKKLQAYDISSDDGAEEYIAPGNEVEEKLIELISKALDRDKIGVNHNIFKIGADSLVAIQLSSQIKKLFQVDVSLRDLFASSNIKALADLIIEMGGKLCEDNEAGQEDEMPVLEKDLENRFEPFPLTDVQQAYWVGRNSFIELGGVSTHVYLEIEQHGMDINRFEEAWQQMIERHEMLRAIIRDDGMQQILEKVPYYHIERIEMSDFSKEKKNEELQKIRDKMSHQILKASEWPLFEIKASLLDEDTLRLHVSIDLLISDVWSSRIVTKELMELYSGSGELPPIDLAFRDYVIADSKLQKTALFEKSWNYWMKRIETLPEAPMLPVVKDPATLDKPHFERRIATIEQKYWDKLKEKANQIGVTHSGLLAAAYSEILSVWSKSSHFTLNLTLFNRLPFHEQVNGIVGDFTSLILLEIDNREVNSFEDRVIRVQQQILEDIDHRYVSGVKVIRELSRMSSNGLKATMPVVFTSTLNLGATEYPSGSLDSGDDVYGISQTPQIWLDHVVSEQDGCLVMNWDAVEELFPKGMLDDMFESYLSLLHRLASDESAWKLSIEELVPLPEAQQDIRAELEVTKDFEHNTLNGLFNKRAQEDPDKIAVIHKDKTLTYGDLYGLSNQLGHLICEKNKNQLVAIVMDKGWEQIVAALGIMQAGYAYLPISAEFPQERIQYLIDNAKVEVVLTVSALRDKLSWLTNVVKVEVDNFDSYSMYSKEPTLVQQKETDLAYVIYTSGSTGQPKGVMIPHKGAVNTILDVNERYHVTSADRTIAVSELNFDLSVYDIFGMLVAGGAIVIPEAQRRKDPSCWLQLLDEEQITVWNSVPAFMNMLVEYTTGCNSTISPSLRLVMLSGDWIPVDLPDKLRKLNNNVQIISLGGATEASIWSNFYEIGEVSEEWRSIPYGKPLTNQKMYILDEHLAKRADWVPGRIYIGGEGLAIGYLNDEELTQSKFIIKEDTKERLYYTGDLGRYLPDGNIEFLGREDFQVKVQGYRIELGEIESAMDDYPEIKNSVVSVYEDESGTKSLVGYYIKNDDAVSDIEEEATVLTSAKGGFEILNDPILDPVERLAFKLKYKSVRKDETSNKVVLSEDVLGSQEAVVRRSYRNFRKDLISLDQLSGLLSNLAYYTDEQITNPKMMYASAGSLYPVQTYIYVKENRVEELSEGLYYYNPQQHALEKISKCHIPDNFYPAGNEAVFAEAAFSIELVGKLDAIKPMYGDWAKAFIKLEAGSICHMLESESTKYHIGLCQIGSMDFSSMEADFKFDGEHMFVQNIVGGLIADDDSTETALQEAVKEISNVVSLVEQVATAESAANEEILNIEPLTVSEHMEQIKDPIERAKFKLNHAGLRAEGESEKVALSKAYIEAGKVQYAARRSYREFCSETITLDSLSKLLGNLKCEHFDKVPFAKRRYASAGNLYPVQTYLYVKPGKIEGLNGGTYYYNPMEHVLVSVIEGANVEDSVFPEGNREIFEKAGFAIFLVAKIGSIAPLYPQDAYNFCMLEAGEISYMLEKNSIKEGIGLCQIGSFDFARIADRFALDDDQMYIHCLLGGKIAKEDTTVEQLVKTTVEFNSAVGANSLDAMKSLGDYQLGTQNSTDRINVEKLKEFLLKKIPKHEVPSIYVPITEIPLSANGKVDRKSLPKPDQQIQKQEKKEFILPDTELEIQISEIWKDIVGMDQVGIYDNFFDLGGNSMHLVKAYNRMKDEISEELPITALFEHPTIHSLSQFILNSSQNDKAFDSEERVERRMERRTRRRELNR